MHKDSDKLMSAKFKKLFEPGNIGKMEVKNRIVMLPLVLNYTEYPYNITKRYIDILEERARGGVGLIITGHVKAESTIDPYPRANMFPALDEDFKLKAFTELADVVHLCGAKIGIQLSPGTGRNADLPIPDKPPPSSSVSPLAFFPHSSTRELALDEIQMLVEALGKAASRAERAGFDTIMLQCSCGYLIDQFLTSVWNRRTDKYGGELENRMRFLVECIESVKSQISTSLPIICRFNSSHSMDVGRPLDENIKIAKRLEKLGVSALDLTTGCYDAIDWLTPPMYYPEGMCVPYAQPIKREIGIPTIVEGRISPELAEKILEEGKAEFIGMGRPLLADPQLPRKAKEGKPEEIIRCIYCNECSDATGMFKRVKCTVNPVLGREKEYENKPVTGPESKNVVVIGGGPGGMQAATRAAYRGHDVTLYEKAEELGGSLRAASAPEFKATIRSLIARQVREVYKAGVKVQLGQEATAETIAELKADVVVLATGASSYIPEVSGIESQIVVTASSALLGESEVGKEVVIIGGGMIGCEVALHLAQQGKQVTIIEILPDIGTNIGFGDKLALLRLMSENKVRWYTDTTLEEITSEGVIANDKDSKRITFKADTVVLAAGMEADDKLYRELEGKVAELYKIGDAREARKIINAIHEGDFIAGEI